MIPINIVSVLVASVVAFILGFLFHGPILGKLWMKLADIHPTGNEKFKDMVPQMLLNLLANFVTALVIAIIFAFASSSPYLAGKTGLIGGVIVAFWLWLGFCVAGSSPEVIWMGRKISLWLFEVVCSFVIIIVIGAIVGYSFNPKTIDDNQYGKIDIRVACESALMYTTFIDGAQAEEFVNDCVDGKYPEVVERYISDMGWNGENI